MGNFTTAVRSINSQLKDYKNRLTFYSQILTVCHVFSRSMYTGQNGTVLKVDNV